MPLQNDKIIPPRAPSPCVERVRLLEELRASLACCSSTVIHGRVGAGKTTLAADFAARAGRAVAWYKVGAADDGLQGFVPYLVAAVRSRYPGFGGPTLSLLTVVRDAGDAPLLAESFVYELTLLDGSVPLLIVIDNLHLVYDAAHWLVPFFKRLLPLLPREVHLLLIAERLPPAPLWRMRSKQTLRVLDGAALKFTPQEAAALFAAHGHDAEQAARAWRQTNGHAAALTAWARGDDDTEFAAATGQAAPPPAAGHADTEPLACTHPA